MTVFDDAAHLLGEDVAARIVADSCQSLRDRPFTPAELDRLSALLTQPVRSLPAPRDATAPRQAA